MKNLKLVLLLLIGGMQLNAQSDSSAQEKTTLKLSGYIDTYYSNFTNQMPANALQPYTTVSGRDQRIGLNVAQVGLHYASPDVRSNLTIHYGDIAQATWSGTFNPVQEANIGFRLMEGLWFDAGFFHTHIGTESFLPKNNPLSSTVVATFNEPFYQAGARLSYEGSERLQAELWVTNGYNFFLDVNSAQSVGALVNYNFNDKSSLTYTNLFGRESPDNASQTQFRTYQNIYFQTVLGDKLFLTLGGDFGTQSNSVLADSTQTALMYNALATVRYQFAERFSTTLRYEVFQDPEGFISGSLPNQAGGTQGLQMQGYTLGLEYRPIEKAYLRPEVRYIQADKSLLLFSTGFSTSNRWEVMLTMGLYFDSVLDTASRM